MKQAAISGKNSSAGLQDDTDLRDICSSFELGDNLALSSEGDKKTSVKTDVVISDYMIDCDLMGTLKSQSKDKDSHLISEENLKDMGTEDCYQDFLATQKDQKSLNTSMDEQIKVDERDETENDPDNMVYEAD